MIPRRPYTSHKLHGVIALVCLGLILAACTRLPAPTLLAPPPTLQNTGTPLPDLAIPATLTSTPITPPAAVGTDSVTPPTTTAAPETPLRFAVIGDYGLAGDAEARVAQLIQSWGPDLIITTGDNNYPDGEAETIDANIGQYYQQYIFPYRGSHGPGADRNRFFPTLGNHDWNTDGAQPYLDYFTLPGNERYYEFTWGPVHFFAVSSDSREPDGVGRSSIQAAWLQERLAASTLPWKIVYFHQAPYSSGYHGSVDWMRWPFKEWGASLVLAGHDHTYERLDIDGLPYIVNGVGGGPIYPFVFPLAGSQVRYNDAHGALLVEVDSEQLSGTFASVDGINSDQFGILIPVKP